MIKLVLTCVIGTTLALGLGYVYHGKLIKDRDVQTIATRDAYWQEKQRKANEQKLREDKASERRYASIPDDTVNSEFERLHPSQKGTRCDCGGELRPSSNYQIGSDQFQRVEDMVHTTREEDQEVSQEIVYDGQIIYHDITSDTCDDFEDLAEVKACYDVLD